MRLGSCRIAVTLLAGIGVGVVVGSTSVLANHIPGATYTGTVNGGGTVTFTVAANGSSVSGFAANSFGAGTGCTSTASVSSIPITDHVFTRTTPSGSPHVTGDFPGTQSAAGTVRSFGICDTGTIGWSATTDAPPPDTTDPETTITSGPDGLTNDSTPAFTFTTSEPGAGSSFQCRVDSDAFAACSSPYTVPAPLPDSPHTFEVQATDAAGNTDDSPAARQFSVDATPPDTDISSGPSGLTNDATPEFSFGAGDAQSFRCQLDSAAFETCQSPHTTAVLIDGPHTFRVVATDPAGNEDSSPAERSFTLDTTPPETFIDSGPPPGSPSPAPFTFHASEPAGFRCSLDGPASAPCTSPHSVPVGPGPHSFSVFAVDAAGNADPSPANLSFTIAGPGPGPSPGPGPGGPTPGPTPALAMPGTANVELLVNRSAGLGPALSRGLPATFGCSLGCHVRGQLHLARRTAKKLKIAAVVGTGIAQISTAGRATLRIRFTSKARKRLKRVRRVDLTLRASFIVAGWSKTLVRRVTLKRNAPAATAPGGGTGTSPGGGTVPQANRPPAFPAAVNFTGSTQYQYNPSTGDLTGATTTVNVTTPPTDPDGDALTYSWTATNGSVQGNGLSATWQRVISSGQPANGDLTVTVSDGRGGSDAHTFQFR